MKHLAVVFATLLAIGIAGVQAQPDFTEHVLSNTYTNANTIDVLDMDGDGDLDFISSRDQAGQIDWWENLGDLSFDRHLVVHVYNPSRLQGGDLNGDGLMDIVVAFDQGSRIQWWENDGNGGWVEHSIDNNYAEARSIDIVDVDLDGDNDVISCGQWRVSWFENTGTYSFLVHDLDANFPGAAMAAGRDFDQDGDIDIFATAYWWDDTAWYVNDGNQNFTRTNLSNTPTDPHWMDVADLDGDLDLDVIISSTADDNLMWYENTLGDFTAHQIPSSVNGPQGIATEDYDNDGDMDMVVAGKVGDALWYFENVGGSFVSTLIGTNLDDVGYVASGNFDGDGDIDFVATYRVANTVALWENHAEDTYDFVTIDLAPFNPPVIVPPVGGTVYFEVTITNGTTEDFSGVAWANARKPNGDPIFFQEQFPIDLDSGEEVVYPWVQLNVPSWAPAGQYVFQGQIGEVFHEPVAEDHFPFTKLDGTNAGGTMNAWGLEGFEPAADATDSAAQLPDEFALNAYPNPFNPSTTVTLALPQDGNFSVVVFDVQGRVVSTLTNGWHQAGVHTIQFNAQHLAAGMYFVQARGVDGVNVTQKLMLLK